VQTLYIVCSLIGSIYSVNWAYNGKLGAVLYSGSAPDD